MTRDYVWEWIVDDNKTQSGISKEMWKKILRMIFGPVMDTVTGRHRIRSNQELRDLYNVHHIKAKRLQWMGHVMRSDDKSILKEIWNGKPSGKRPLGRPRLRWRDQVYRELNVLGNYDVDGATQDRIVWRAKSRSVSK